jgi:tripartite-type tricarboxylate transporter receptor subunit TctC
VHVPYSGSNELVNGIISGQLQMTFITPGVMKQYIDAGKVRLLAVTSPKRYPLLPDVPTIVEGLPGYEPIITWFAFFGPAGLARPIVMRLHGEIAKVLNAPEVRSRLSSMSLQVIASSPDELGELMKAEAKIYARIVKAVGIQPQ